MRDLSKIKAAYENGEGTLQALAERFSVPVSTIKKRAAQEKWDSFQGKLRKNALDVKSENGTKIGQNGTKTEENGTKIGQNRTKTEENGTKTEENGTKIGQNGTKTEENGTKIGQNRTKTEENGTKIGQNGTKIEENGTKAEQNGTKNKSDSQNGTIYIIPPQINEWDRIQAATFYHQLGWAIHPICAPDRGDELARGKKPLLKGWRNHTSSDISSDFLLKYFAANSSNNIGCVVRSPFVHVDLDSKPDGGASVHKWIEAQTELAAIPRERTGGGAHLVFRCHDLPEELLKAKKAPSVQLTPHVSAELYVDGLNIVLSPSIHKSGHRYSWEVTGEIPEVKWTSLCRWFGFSTPKAKKLGRPSKEKPWWSKWPEDLRSLDLTGILNDLGFLGTCLDPDTAKWSVRCPWEADHTGGISEVPGSDTVIFNQPETLPAFHCLHAHCQNRTAEDLLEWIEEQDPGVIARHCTDLRVWTPENKIAGARPKIILPCTGRSATEFGEELGASISSSLGLFCFSNDVVEIIEVEKADKRGAIPGHMLSPVKPVGLVTAVERTVDTGVLQKDEAGDKVFVPKSMTEQDARITLSCRAFSKHLPRIVRILDVPVPQFGQDGKLVYPSPGYDPRFGTWLIPSAPQLRSMGFEEAITLLLGELFALPEHGGFWWHDAQARLHALARLITPFCRGLMDWQRSPLWIFDGNREGCGKDTCADVTHLVYAGRSIICAPLSKDGDDEMRKRITAALSAGSRFFHLANMKGHIRYASLEAATDDSGTWEDRRLGASETLVLANETEFSFSANNATWEPDIERRCRRIRLRFAPDEVNSHRYRHPNLRAWIRQHRSDLLSAINTLVSHWVMLGSPPGPTPFTSFSEWGRVVGGILTACALGDPCLPHEDSQISGDQNTRAMRDFFELMHSSFGDEHISKAEFQKFLQDDETVHEIFDWIDFTSRRGLISFGRILGRFDGRELRRILLTVNRTSKNRCTYRFSKLDYPESSSFSTVSASTSLPEGGSAGYEGNIHIANIARENAGEKNNYREAFIESYIGDSKTSLSSLTSPSALFPVFCSSREELGKIVEDLSCSLDGRIALDIETYGHHKKDGLNPWRGDIRLLTLCRKGGPIWILDLRAIGYDLGPLGEFLEGATLIIHNAKFDALWLTVKCGLRLHKLFCTLTAARLFVAGTTPGNKLDQCLDRYLGVEPGNDQSLSDWGAMLLTDEQLAYAARDVEHLHDLAHALETEMERADLARVWELESKVLPRVVEMEATGILVDVKKLHSIADEANRTAEEATVQLRDAFNVPKLNPASPKQLLEALRAQGIELTSTNEGTLKEMDDGKLIPLILAYREASKRAQQAKTLIEHVASDGRIHARFEPTGTATGRFSSKEPNLQNIGRGELRSAFVPAPNHKFIDADYSQVELRAAAAIAGETKMIAAYQSGADLHRLTASIVLGKSEDKVTKADRQTAKSCNFGLIYGQSAPGLVRYAATAYGVTLIESEAREIRSAFFRTYGHLRQWHGESHQQAEKGVKEVRTRLGRRRLIPKTASEWERFTALVNTPVQGGCADGMKLAIVDLADRLPPGSHIVSTVHDEVIVEVPEQDVEEVRELVATVISEAMETLFPEVPIEVESGICSHWGEK